MWRKQEAQGAGPTNVGNLTTCGGSLPEGLLDARGYQYVMDRKTH